MDDKRKDADDFFKDHNPVGDSRDKGAGMGDTEKAGGSQERPSYYSYGPFKSSDPAGPNDEPTTSVSRREGSGQPVEMTPPRPLRTMEEPRDPDFQRPITTWSPGPQKRRSSLKSGFAAFLAGAVVVGSLMLASDKMNLFTNHQGAMNAGGSSPAASTNNGGAKPAALDVARPANIAQMVQQSSPAVVKIETKVKAQSRSGKGGGILNDPFFRQFFGDQFGGGGGDGTQQQPNPNGGSLQPAGMGSGFIFEKSGYILTNQHVVDGADQIEVTVQGYDKPFVAKLLGNSFDLDLAVLKIEGDKDFPMLPLGDANSVSVGDWVVAIGNPYGFDHTVTVGVLSAKERPIDIPESQGTRQYKHLLQTDASINPGNSGGPLLNLNGEVIGINTAVSAQAQGIGFAIPTTTINDVLDKLKNNVKIPKEPLPYVGVQLSDIDQAYLKDLNLPNANGALVESVLMGSPGFKAGMKQNDVILSVNGTEVKNSADAVKKIQATKVGDKVTLGIMRDGKKVDVEVTVGDRNNDPSVQKQPQAQQ